MRHKFTKFIITCSVLGMTAVTTMASVISDVSTSHWAYKSIAHIQQAGIMTVSSTGEFRPSANVSYFNACVALARATGYVDPSSANIDSALKEAIQKNYEKQLPIINKYIEKNPSWDKTATKEIAYLLGRGYLKESELDKFMGPVTNGKQTPNVITKQDLAVFIVRMLQKEETAKSTYTTTGFSDEALISAENRPHVAYLKKLGLVSGDAANTFGANTKVTRALCAKMLSDGLNYLEANKEVEKPVETTMLAGSIKKVMEKNATENYVLIEKDGKTSFYSMKKTTLVNSGSTTVAVDKIAVGTSVQFETEVVGGTEYISKMIVGSGNSSNNTGNGNTTPTTPTTPEAEKVTVQGTVDRVGSNGDISVTNAEGISKTYLTDGCTVQYNGKVVSMDQVVKGATVKLTLVNEKITSIEIVELPSNTSNITGEVTSIVELLDGFKLNILGSDNKTTEITIAYSTEITKNNKKADWEALKLGDSISIKLEGNTISEIKATSTKGISTGKLKAVLIAKQPQIIVETSAGDKVFNVMADSEIYDNNKRENVSLRDLRLGQTVEVSLESKEVLSIVVQKGTTSVTYKGTIKDVASGGKSIGVLVDYDAVTGQTQLFKRFDIPQTVNITDGKSTVYRTSLKEGMNVIVTFEYEEDLVPQKILILE